MDLSDLKQDEDVTETHVEEPADVAEEPTVAAKRGKRKLIDLGVESRKKQLLYPILLDHMFSYRALESHIGYICDL